MDAVLSKPVWPAVRKPETNPTYEETARAMTRANLRPGETLVVGGLTQKRTWTETRQVPLLSKLPGVDSYFQYWSSGPYDMELLVVVRPRLVNPSPERN